MQNYVRNTMQFRKSLYDEGLQSYGRFVPKHSQNMEKDSKLKDFHFSSACEDGELPCMLQ